jgi:hypothetical protein
MANVLNTDKQIAVIGALAEGSSIRSIERITGVHRDTIMRLGVKVGQGCATLLDTKMRDLPCQRLEFDEIWGFIGKKERHLRQDDDPQYGLSLLLGDCELFPGIHFIHQSARISTLRLSRQNLGLVRHFAKLNVEEGRSNSRNSYANDSEKSYLSFKGRHGFFAYLQGILFIAISGFTCYLAAGLIWERSWLDIWSRHSTGKTLSARFGDNFSGLAVILLILVAAGFFYHGMARLGLL